MRIHVRIVRSLGSVLLVLFGCLVAIATVEAALQVTSLVYQAVEGSRLRQLRFPSGNAKVLKILCVGDSNTWGMGAGSPNKSYPSVLQGLFNSAGSIPQAQVINEAIPGQNSSQLLKSLENQIQRYRPDIVLVLIGANNESNFLDLNIQATSTTANRMARALSHLRVYRMFSFVIDWFRRVSYEQPLQQETLKSIFALATDENSQKVHAQSDAAAGIPDTFDEVMSLGWKAFERRDFEQSAHFFKAAGHIRPVNPGWHHGLGRVYFMSGKMEHAIEEFCACLHLDTCYVPAYTGLGETYISLCRFDIAIELLKQALAYSPNDAGAHRLLANAFNGRFVHDQQRRPEDSERARKELAIAFELDHDFADTAYRLSQCNSDKRQFLREFKDLLAQAKYLPTLEERRQLDKYEKALLTQGVPLEPARQSVGNRALLGDLKRIAQLCRGYGVDLRFLTYPAGFSGDTVIRQAAEQDGVKLIDLDKIFGDERRSQKDLYFIPDWHPNANGYALVANIIYDHILRGSRSGRTGLRRSEE